MLYVFAIAMGLLAAALALLLPIWLREGPSGVLRVSGRAVPTLAVILVILVAIAWAMTARLDGLVNVVLAMTSIAAVAGWWLVRRGFSGRAATWTRSLLLVALIVSLLVLALSIGQLIQGA
jgi:hypothetical protein